jgi:hypothetical protein
MPWTDEQKRVFIRQAELSQQTLATFFRFFLVGILVMGSGLLLFVLYASRSSGPGLGFLPVVPILIFGLVVVSVVRQLRYATSIIHRPDSPVHLASALDRLLSNATIVTTTYSAGAPGAADPAVPASTPAPPGTPAAPSSAVLAVASAYLGQGRDLDAVCRLVEPRFAAWSPGEQQQFRDSVAAGTAPQAAPASALPAAAAPAQTAGSPPTLEQSLASLHPVGDRAQVDLQVITSWLDHALHYVPLVLLSAAAGFGAWYYLRMGAHGAGDFWKFYFGVLAVLLLLHFAGRTHGVSLATPSRVTFSVQTTPTVQKLDPALMERASQLLAGGDVRGACRQVLPQFETLPVFQQRVFEMALPKVIEAWRNQKIAGQQT